MNRVGAISFFGSLLVSNYLLVSRSYTHDIRITKSGDYYKATMNDHFIGLSDHPYCAVQRGLFYDTIVFGTNKVNTMSSVGDVLMD